MMRLLILLLILLQGWSFAQTTPSPSPVSMPELDTLLAAENFWTLKPGEFMEAAQPWRFEWLSVDRNAARSDFRKNRFRGLRIFESIVSFEKDVPKQVTLAFYARGDAGDITRNEYEELLRKTIATLDEFTKSKFIPRGKDTSSATKADGVLWKTPALIYTLEYSFTKEDRRKFQPFRAEFIRLEITPVREKPGILEAHSAARKKAWNGPSRVKKEADGTVILKDVPMVDQGAKGYCAVATAERIMRYYGRDVDSNELAQVMSSDSSSGTDSDEMFAALKKLTTRLQVRTRVIMDMDYKEFVRLINDYNRAAKRIKADPLPDPEGILNASYYYSRMQPSLYQAVRMKDRAGLQKFQRSVIETIDQGIPLCWGVRLGMVKEPEIPQANGGHMRLIIGYNTGTEEIIYSDSWGAGHEQKKMKLADAWTITTNLTRIEPF